MTYTCNDVPELTEKVAKAQEELDASIAKRARAKAEAEKKGKPWEGTTIKASLDAEVAEDEAKLAEVQAGLAEAQAACGNA